MKKALFVVLIAVFVLGFAATAFAATPTVIGANGASAFTYKDLQDSAAKYQGGYAAFNGGATIYADNGQAYGDATQVMPGFGPHGGYDTATNKCQVCHAVHRAEGAYYLLRADSQDDACDYCHVGGSAHSNKIVYTANTAGTATTNGHTMGASSAIPDSTDKMWTAPVTLQAAAADGSTISQVINVRGYDTAENQMYRLEISAHSADAGHPMESGSAYATVPAWDRVGPLALRCSNCHQVHDALAQVWHPTTYDANQGTTYASTGADGTSANQLLYGWNLLRRYPSATIVGYVAPTVNGGYTPNSTVAVVPFKNGSVTVLANSRGFANWPTSLLVKVPETTLTVGVNYSSNKSSEATYTENGIVTAQPTWVVSAGWSDATPATINNLNTSVWCADCHNLNVGGTQKLTYTELGFRSHAERTHPAPYAHGGQCYSCHRNDLGATVVAGATTAKTQDSGCDYCHYGASKFVTQLTASDFPHSGSNDSVKLLGNYSINTPVWNATSGTYTMTEAPVAGGISTANLDAVCIRCHPSTGVHN